MQNYEVVIIHIKGSYDPPLISLSAAGLTIIFTALWKQVSG